MAAFNESAAAFHRQRGITVEQGDGSFRSVDEVLGSSHPARRKTRPLPPASPRRQQPHDPQQLGVALIGNPGLSRSNPIERNYRDVLCSRIHTPQDDTILTTTGTAALDALEG
jgi:hypothetical protein